MARLLLDSTGLSAARRGGPAAARLAALRRTGTEPWACVVSVEEIWRGLRADEEAVARRLFRGLRLAPLGVAEGMRAGVWRRAFAKRGVTLHQADCLIAAAAAGVGAALATANLDDFPMTEVNVQHWPAGRVTKPTTIVTGIGTNNSTSWIYRKRFLPVRSSPWRTPPGEGEGPCPFGGGDRPIGHMMQNRLSFESI